MTEEIKFDKRNYRIHDDENKKLIKKSLKENGTGRSILIDKEGEIIAGNGVYEQASKLKIPVKVVETDGSELIAIKRTDLSTDDVRRKQLAVLDNSTSDSSTFDFDMLQEDFGVDVLNDLGIDVDYEEAELEEYKAPTPQEPQSIEELVENLPEELKDTKLTPEVFNEVVGSFKPLRERVIITFPEDRKQDMANILGLPELAKIVYTIEELTGDNKEV